MMVDIDTFLHKRDTHVTLLVAGLLPKPIDSCWLKRGTSS